MSATSWTTVEAYEAEIARLLAQGYELAGCTAGVTGYRWQKLWNPKTREERAVELVPATRAQ